VQLALTRVAATPLRHRTSGDVLFVAKGRRPGRL